MPPDLNVFRNQTGVVSNSPVKGAGSPNEEKSPLFENGLANIFEKVVDKGLSQYLSKGQMEMYNSLKE